MVCKVLRRVVVETWVACCAAERRAVGVEALENMDMRFAVPAMIQETLPCLSSRDGASQRAEKLWHPVQQGPVRKVVASKPCRKSFAWLSTRDGPDCS